MWTFLWMVIFGLCAWVLVQFWLKEGMFNNMGGGVYSSERLLEDPDGFLSELIERGLEIYYHE